MTRMGHSELQRRMLDENRTRRCGWCLVAEATDRVHSVDSCQSCAEADAHTRVRMWMSAVQGGRR